MKASAALARPEVAPTRGCTRRRTRPVAESTRRALWAYLFISPFYLSFLVFNVFPIFFSFYLATTRWTPYQSTWIGLDNFANLLQDRLVHLALFNSLWLMVVISTIQISLVLVIAVALNARKLRGGHVLRGIFFLPYITSPVVLGLVWGVIFAYTGLLNYLLGLVGVGPVDWLGYHSSSRLGSNPRSPWSRSGSTSAGTCCCSPPACTPSRPRFSRRDASTARTTGPSWCASSCPC
jgi:ABC-type sugar transport system permease subunit